MSIIERVAGSKFMLLSGMSSKLLTKTLTGGSDTPVTIFKECIGALTVFGDLDNVSDETIKSDFSSFIEVELDNTIVKFELLDGKGNLISVLNDNTYGKFFPKGFAPGNDFFQQLYLGFRVQWRKVLDLEGPGLYQIKTTINPFLPPFIPIKETLSCLFNLCQYTDERADETARIETTQNGKIIGQGLDFTGLNWRQQIRIPGFFGFKQRRLEQDDYLDKNRRVTQIQDKLIHEYTLEPTLWPECLRDFIDEMILANNILISDYNLDNTDNLKSISVKPLSIDTEYFAKSKKAADEIKFEERTQNRVKRNVK